MAGPSSAAVVGAHLEAGRVEAQGAHLGLAPAEGAHRRASQRPRAAAWSEAARTAVPMALEERAGPAVLMVVVAPVARVAPDLLAAPAGCHARARPGWWEVMVGPLVASQPLGARDFAHLDQERGPPGRTSSDATSNATFPGVPEVVLASFNAHAGARPRALPELRSLVSWGGSGAGGNGSSRSANGETPEIFDLAGAIAGLDADVIVVQEAFRPDSGPSPLDEAAAALGYELHEVSFGRAALAPWPHLSSGGTGQVGLAVLSRLPVLRHTPLPIRPVPFDPASSRQALHLELDVEGAALHVVGVHLTSRLPHGPAMQLRHLRPQLPHAAQRAILAGDFNFWGTAVAALAEGWQRAVRGPTWPARRPHSQIDHVLVRHGIEVLSGEVLEDLGSDHRPIRACLRLG